MKKIKSSWVLYSLFVVVLLLPLGIKIYNDFFPMAETIQLPTADKISKIEISKGDLIIEYNDGKTIEKITQVFLKAEPTRNLSVNDEPTVREYYLLNIIEENSNNAYRSYIYEENYKWFIEKHYWGVYEIEKKVELDFLEYLY